MWWWHFDIVLVSSSPFDYGWWWLPSLYWQICISPAYTKFLWDWFSWPFVVLFLQQHLLRHFWPFWLAERFSWLAAMVTIHFLNGLIGWEMQPACHESMVHFWTGPCCPAWIAPGLRPRAKFGKVRAILMNHPTPPFDFPFSPTYTAGRAGMLSHICGERGDLGKGNKVFGVDGCPTCC